MTEKKISAQSRAKMKWNAAHLKQMKINLNLETDKDIIDELDRQPSKQGYIKELIRADIAKRKESQ